MILYPSKHQEILFMAVTAQQLFAQCQFYNDPRDYAVISLPARAIMAAAGVVAEYGEAFSVIIADKDEVTLVLLAEAWPDFAERLPGHRVASDVYRLITFDLELDMSLVGFMALISNALADAGISILPLAAFTRDHLLVKSDQVESALAALRHLQTSLHIS
jgi:hypothetical protein